MEFLVNSRWASCSLLCSLPCTSHQGASGEEAGGGGGGLGGEGEGDGAAPGRLPGGRGGAGLPRPGHHGQDRSGLPDRDQGAPTHLHTCTPAHLHPCTCTCTAQVHLYTVTLGTGDSRGGARVAFRWANPAPSWIPLEPLDMVPADLKIFPPARGARLRASGCARARRRSCSRSTHVSSSPATSPWRRSCWSSSWPGWTSPSPRTPASGDSW